MVAWGPWSRDCKAGDREHEHGSDGRAGEGAHRYCIERDDNRDDYERRASDEVPEVEDVEAGERQDRSADDRAEPEHSAERRWAAAAEEKDHAHDSEDVDRNVQDEQSGVPRREDPRVRPRELRERKAAEVPRVIRRRLPD